MDFERELADFRYYAIFKDGVGSVDQAYMLVREPEANREQEYLGVGVWVPTDKLHRLAIGKDWTEDEAEITEAEALELRQLLDKRWTARWRHHVISADGTPFAVVVSPKNPDWHVSPHQIDRRLRGGLTATNLLHRVAEEPAWSVEDVEPATATETLARMEQRRRGKAGLLDRYAVFQTLTDVLDLYSATEVVRWPSRGHEFTLRLDRHEADHLTALLDARKVRRQAGTVGGHQHFGLFHRTEDAKDPRNAYSVIRSTVDSGPRHWEVFLRPGQWLPASEPSDRTTSLPLGPADLAAATTRLAAGERRYLRIRSWDRGPVAHLRLTGTTEEAANDLGWEPSDFLTRLPDEESWFVFEEDEKTMDAYRPPPRC
ncbi:MAG TPA: hypothetical protein VF821_27085 [Lentzea sp.]